MTWVDDAKQKFEQAMQQFKGKRFPCALCGQVGEYDKDLEPLIANIGRFGIARGNTYTASVESSFACKDIKACYKRQESKTKQSS